MIAIPAGVLIVILLFAVPAYMFVLLRDQKREIQDVREFASRVQKELRDHMKEDGK